MKNPKSILSIWIVLFVLGGKGLAQTSDSTRRPLAPFYAQFEIGSGLSGDNPCNIELVACASLGLHVSKGLDLGLTYFYNDGLGRFSRNERQLHGIGLQARYQWRKFGLIAEAGRAIRYRDGCNDEWSGENFAADPNQFHPYFRIRPFFQPERRLYFWLSWTQTPFMDGTYSYWNLSVWGSGPAQFRARSAHLGVGIYFGS